MFRDAVNLSLRTHGPRSLEASAGAGGVTLTWRTPRWTLPHGYRIERTQMAPGDTTVHVLAANHPASNAPNSAVSFTDATITTANLPLLGVCYRVTPVTSVGDARTGEIGIARQGSGYPTFGAVIAAVGEQVEGNPPVRLSATRYGTHTDTVAHEWTVTAGTLSGSETEAGTSATSALESPWWHLPDDIDADVLATVSYEATAAGQCGGFDAIDVLIRDCAIYVSIHGAISPTRAGGPQQRLRSLVRSYGVTGPVLFQWACDLGFLSPFPHHHEGFAALQEGESFWFPPTFIEGASQTARVSLAVQQGPEDAPKTATAHVDIVVGQAVEECELFVVLAAVDEVDEGSGAVLLGASVVGTHSAAEGTADRYLWSLDLVDPHTGETIDPGFLGTAVITGTSRTSTLVNPAWWPPGSVSQDTAVRIRLTVERTVALGNPPTLCSGTATIDALVRNVEGLTALDIRINAQQRVNEGTGPYALTAHVSGEGTARAIVSWRVDIGFLGITRAEAANSAVRSISDRSTVFWLPPADVTGDQIARIVGTVRRADNSRHPADRTRDELDVTVVDLDKPQVPPPTFQMEIDCPPTQDVGNVPVRLTAQYRGTATGAVDFGPGGNRGWSVTVGTLSDDPASPGRSRTSNSETPYWHLPASLESDERCRIHAAASRQGAAAQHSCTVLVQASVPDPYLTVAIDGKPLPDMNEGVAFRLSALPDSNIIGRTEWGWSVTAGTLSASPTSPGSATTSDLERPWWHLPQVDADTDATVSVTATRRRGTQSASGTDSDTITVRNVGVVRPEPTLDAVIVPVADRDESTAPVRVAANLTGTYVAAPVYEWSVTHGSLDDAASATPLLTLPDVMADTTVTLSLTVTAGFLNDGTTPLTASDTESFTVRFVAGPGPGDPDPPDTFSVAIAALGDVQENASYGLSYEPGGTATGDVEETWTLEAGTPGSLDDASLAAPTWAIGEVAADTPYRIALSATRAGITATDAISGVVRDTVTCSVAIAAVADQTAGGADVALSAAVGGNARGNIVWAWGANVGSLSGANTATPTWHLPATVDAETEATIRVWIRQGDCEATDTEQAMVSPPPATLGVSIAGAPASVYERDAATRLDRAITGTARGPVVYAWTCSIGTFTSGATANRGGARTSGVPRPYWHPPADVAADATAHLDLTITRGGLTAHAARVAVAVRDYAVPNAPTCSIDGITRTGLRVNWTPGATGTGIDAVTGYRVELRQGLATGTLLQNPSGGRVRDFAGVRRAGGGRRVHRAGVRALERGRLGGLHRERPHRGDPRHRSGDRRQAVRAGDARAGPPCGCRLP